MIVLVGRGGSGKDAILSELQACGMKPIVSYTTRPPRVGEVDGIDYNFITDEGYLHLKGEGFFTAPFETQGFNGSKGVMETWRYGLAVKDIEHNGVVILTPSGARELQEKFGKDKIIVVYVKVKEEELIMRMAIRGDNIQEVTRRVEADRKDFKNVDDIADFVFYNANTDVLNFLKSVKDFHAVLTAEEHNRATEKSR